MGSLDSSLSTLDGDDDVVRNGDNADLNVLTTTSTSVGGDPAGGFGTTADVTYAFGDGWTTISADRPAILYVELTAETDGATSGVVQVRVDESGGTTRDYQRRTHADIGLGTGGKVIESYEIYVPAGGTFQIVNVSDPSTGNAINDIRELVL